MNKQDVFALLGNVFGIDADEIDPHDDFYEDLNADSTDLIELKLQLEDLLKTEIDQDEFMDVKTVEDLLSLIEDYADEFLA